MVCISRAARITLQNADTGIHINTTTDTNGNYQFLTVKAGRYTVTAEASGFKKAQAEPFVLRSTRDSAST